MSSVIRNGERNPLSSLDLLGIPSTPIPSNVLSDNYRNRFTPVPSARGAVSIVTEFGHFKRDVAVQQVPFEVLESLSSNKALFNLILENYPNLLLCRSNSVNHLTNVVPSAGKDTDGRTSDDDDDHRQYHHQHHNHHHYQQQHHQHWSDTPPLVMKMKLKQSKKSNSMGSGVVSPLDSHATSPPLTYTADNSPERQPRAHHAVLKRQCSTTQSSYLKSLPYHRSVDCRRQF